VNWKDKFPKENIHFETENGILYCGDCLKIFQKFSNESVNLIVTSPPYNKGNQNKTFTKRNTWKNANINYDNYNDNLPEIEYQKWQKTCVKEFVRIITNDGSIFYNHKPRTFGNKVIFPNEWLDEFIIKQLIIWDRGSSPNIENTRFYPTTEYIYWITKQNKTPKFFRNKAIFKKEIWTIIPQKNENHPAPFPEELPKNCILATTIENDIVLDPFLGSGTTCVVAEKLNRRWIGIEISEKYCEITKQRIFELKKQKKIRF